MHKNPHKNIDIDIGLDVLCSLSQKGDTLTLKDIADVCNCTANYIGEVEKRALRKFKAAINLKHNVCDLV